MNPLLVARIAVARSALASPLAAEGALLLRTSAEPPVAFFASLAPRTIGPRVGVELTCDLIVYLVPAGGAVIGCGKWLPAPIFAGEPLRRRFDGCGLEGSQWMVTADASGVVLEHDVSTNGTRFVRDDDAALPRFLQQPLRFADLVRGDIGVPLPLRTKCSLALREGDVLATVFEAWVFAPVVP